MILKAFPQMLLVACMASLLPGCGEDIAIIPGDARFALTLEEIAHWPVSGRADLVGGTIVDSATILVWNQERDLWLLADGNRGELTNLDLRATPSINRVNGGVLLLASDNGSLLMLAADGTTKQLGVRCPEAKAARLLLAQEERLAVVLPGGDHVELLGMFAVTPTSCEPI